MSYPPYQQFPQLQSDELKQIIESTSASLARDEVFSSMVIEKLSDKINAIVVAETTKLRSRIEYLEYENRKIRQKLDDDERHSKTSSSLTSSDIKKVIKSHGYETGVGNVRPRTDDVQQDNDKNGVKQKGYGQRPPYGGAPYPPQNSASYPTAQAPYPSTQPPYPSQTPPGGIYAPSLGFKIDAPMFMPTSNSSYPPQPPQSTSPYANTSSPYPPPSSQINSYPPQPTQSNASYANTSSSYSSQSSQVKPYPPPGNSPYGNTSSIYPPQPPQVKSYPRASSPYRSTSSYSNTTPYPSSSSYNMSSVHSSSTNTRSSYPSAQQHTSATYSTSSLRQHAQPPKTSYPSGVSYQTNTSYSPSGGQGLYYKKATPTVVPANPFNARADADTLRKAMKGFGTDEKAIISVVTRRSNAQRLQIAVEFKTLYGKDLIKDLKSETSGKFEDLLVALMTPLPQYYAKELHDAISGLGTDEDVLIEVLCTKSNTEIRTIRAAFHSMYGRSLEDDLIGDTSGTFKRLMVSLCNACRDESTGTNAAAAAKDAQDLLRAGELKLGTDESTFNMILCQRSFAQLRLIFDEYYRITGHDFENAIKNEFSGNSKDGLLAIVRSIRNQPGFFAKCLHNAIAGLGTNDRQLIRVIVTRCEIDMAEIKQNYLAQYGETLADAIKGDTSGDYKKCLFALIGES